MAFPKIINIPEGDEGALQYHYKRVEVSSAEILTANSAPLELVEAPGAGYILIPILAVWNYDFVSVVYGANVDLDIRLDTGGIILQQAGLIALGANRIVFSGIGTLGGAQIANNAIILTEPSGDPTGGDGTLTISLWYVILKL